MTPSQIKKTNSHQRKKRQISFKCSRHLVVCFYPRIQLLFRLSRCLAVLTGLNIKFAIKNSIKDFGKNTKLP